MLGEKTVEKILAAASKLGYVPNHTARALSTGRYANLALVVPDIANPFFPPLIQAAQAEADRSNFCVFLGNSGENARQEDKLLDRFAGQVEGMVLASSRLSEERIHYHGSRQPLVLVNRDVKGIPRVLIDSGEGVTEAVAHLASLGHKKIVYVSGPSQSWSNRQRRAAFRRAAQLHVLDTEIVPAQLSTHEAGQAAAGAIIATGATAAIAFDDLLAQGIMAGMSEAGLAIPRDFSIIGCDDVLGAATYPALTTVSNRSIEAGKTAASLLLESLRTGVLTDARYLLGTHLVIRNTTDKPR